jgi:hypothetical protein
MPYPHPDWVGPGRKLSDFEEEALKGLEDGTFGSYQMDADGNMVHTSAIPQK